MTFTAYIEKGENKMYCIECEKEEEVKFNSWHHKEWGDMSILCGGPFTTCPPPPDMTDEDWEFVFSNEPELEAQD